MGSKKKPRKCGGCPSTESASWHRQRGNNKFFCDACQEKKLLSKQFSGSADGVSLSVNFDDPSTSTNVPTEISEPGNTDQVESSPDENVKTIETSNEKEEPADTGLDKETTGTSPCEHPKQDECKTMEESTPDNVEEEEESKVSKRQVSPIVQPVVTRLRSSTRPIRAAATRIQFGEKRSHSRCSSANGTSIKSQGSSIISAGNNSSPLVIPRNKSRRHIFKLIKPEKAPSFRASMTTSASLWHKGQLFRQDDVVALVDETDGNVYYAMIRGLLRDEYCQQFACVTWLVPTTAAPVDSSFDAAAYMLGPEDETFYPLTSLEFVCHIDAHYFKARGATVSSFSTVRSRGIDSSLHPQSQFVGIV